MKGGLMVDQTIDTKEEKQPSTEERFMLTTIDNPYNPFTEFKAWQVFDEGKGYYTLGYLARVANVSDALSEKDYELEIRNAMSTIIKENVYGVHRLFSSKTMSPVPV